MTINKIFGLKKSYINITTVIFHPTDPDGIGNQIKNFFCIRLINFGNTLSHIFYYF